MGGSWRAVGLPYWACGAQTEARKAFFIMKPLASDLLAFLHDFFLLVTTTTCQRLFCMINEMQCARKFGSDFYRRPLFSVGATESRSNLHFHASLLHQHLNPHRAIISPLLSRDASINTKASSARAQSLEPITRPQTACHFPRRCSTTN